MTENAAIKIIEDKVQEIEQERKLLSSECDILRSENKWFRKKVAELEKTLILSEGKHNTLKSK
jgi:predicted nuclease with TOPRIM domain